MVTTRQSLGVETVHLSGDLAQDQRAINNALTSLLNYLDQQVGARGTPKFIADVNLTGHRLTEVGTPKAATDAQQYGLCLSHPSTGVPFDAQHLRLINLAEGVETLDGVNLGQLRNALSSAAFALLSDATPLSVETVGLPGTGTLASREDHVHLGVNLDDAQTIDGLKTLNNHLRFIDATWNIGAAGASRPANLYLSAAVLEGAWQATQVAALYGGTGQPGGYTVGDMLVASGAAALSRVAAVATGQVWASTGIGVTPAWSATPTLTSVVLPSGTLTGLANPSASLGLTAINGVATTAMRSDAAPALSVAIAPTWTGKHVFQRDSATTAVNDAIGEFSSVNNISNTAGAYTGLRFGGVTNTGDAYPAGAIAIDYTPGAGILGSNMRLRNVSAAGSYIDALYLHNTGNVGLSTTGVPTGGGPALAFAQGSDPTGIGANTAGCYAKDVAGTAEFFGFDEAGNFPQLTPHPSDALDLFPVSVSGPYALPWVHRNANLYMGQEITVDMAGVVAAVEQMFGRSFTTIRKLPAEERRDWIADQDIRIQQQTDAFEAQQMRHAESIANGEPFRETMLTPYVRKHPPQWLAVRGVKG